ncbi:hypothetical protein ES703_41650 [subsurface metagenome]
MWGSLKNQKEREKLTELVMESERDYLAIFVKRVKGASFFLTKYGARTIWEKSEDEEWCDAYNWYVKLYVKENGGFEEIGDEGFLSYAECLNVIERLTGEYPQKFFEGEKEEETVELPEHAKFIAYQALEDIRKGVPLKEVKAKVAGTAVGVDHKVQKQVFKLLEMASKRGR